MDAALGMGPILSIAARVISQMIQFKHIFGAEFKNQTNIKS
jgi:hypothetical protein